jgi:hypothetical protein
MALEVIRLGISLESIGFMMVTILISGLSGLFFFAFYSKYKNELKLFECCTKPSKGVIKHIGLSSHNVGGRNPTFITVEFSYHERTFNNVSDQLRFEYKEGDSINILHNPDKRSEFIFV